MKVIKVVKNKLQGGKYEQYRLAVPQDIVQKLGLKGEEYFKVKVEGNKIIYELIELE